MTREPSSPSPTRQLVPLLLFCLLGGLTLLVWHQQVEHQRLLLENHTRDVCVQAARRLAIRLESRLRVARIFALRWSTHEGRDFSRKRFEEFSSVLMREIPAYHAIHLVWPDTTTRWQTPRGVLSSWSRLGAAGRRLLRAAARKRRPILSAPIEGTSGVTSIFAVMPLLREAESLGHLVIEFRSEALVSEVFHQRIRTEFNILVEDGGIELFRFARPGAAFAEAPHGVRQSVPARNRTWRMTIVPRQAQSGWVGNLPVPLLGFPLSGGLSLLAFLLLRRMEMYRAARDRALREIAERERAQRALSDAEARYHSVFDSATDGLLIIDDADRVMEVNQAAARMHGFSPEQLAGHPYGALIAPGHQHLFTEFKRQLDQFGTVHLDSVHVHQDGSTREVEVRGVCLSDSGEPRTLVIVTDVSDLRRAVQRHAQLSRKVLIAQEEERARVSRELHDELGQILTAIRLELDMHHKRAVADPERAAEALGSASPMVENAANELRRICRGLRPPLLDDLGIEPAVQQLVEEFTERTGLAVDAELQIDESERRIPMEVSLCTYRILQESLNNISRHAEAREVSISLGAKGGELMLSVYDDGKGFDPKEVGSSGYGVAGMVERAYLVDGTVDIRSEPFQGTRVTFRVPLERPVMENRDDGQDNGAGG